MSNIIEARNIVKAFKTGNGENFFALKGVDIDIPRGTLTILKGRSGSGKTTLLNILSTLDEATMTSYVKDENGEMIDSQTLSKEEKKSVGVWFEDNKYEDITSREKEHLRRTDIGFIFQGVALIPIMNAYENVDFALRLAEYKGETKDRILEVLDKVDMTERMLHFPGQMSGGEQQRIAIARAVAHKPKVIFADEPTGALDTNTGIKVMKLFKELIKKEGITIVMTTHDPGLMELGDVVYEIEDGEVIDKIQN